MKSHTLNVTNAAKILAANMLNVPEQFKTTTEVLRAGMLCVKVQESLPEPEKRDEAWANQKVAWEVTEAERDILKASAERITGKIPPNAHSVSLLKELGFTE